MEQVNSVFTSIINTDENGKIIIAFSPEEWRLVQIAIKNYNCKLESARKHYHKTKQLKGKQKLAIKTPLMEKYSQLSQIEVKTEDTPIAQTKSLSCRNCATRMRKPHADYPDLCCFCRPKRKTIK